MASLVVRSGMGYDSWAWLVWGRELLHLDLHTEGGPSWKPLPVLLIAPFTPFGALAPALWLAFSRAAGFAALFFAYRLTVRLTTSRLAGLACVFGLAVTADFFVTALRGYSEPVLIALALGAIDQHLAGRRTAALVLVGIAGLLRPEVWLFAAAYGAFLIPADRSRRSAMGLVRIAILVGAAPLLWLALDWYGSGDPLQSSQIAATSPMGSAAKGAVPAFTVVGRIADAVIVPVLVLALLGVLLAGRRLRSAKALDSDRVVLWLGAVAATWIAVVAVMAEMGFTGRRRYLAVAAAIVCVCAAIGAADLLRELRSPRAQRLAAGAIAVVLLAFGFSPARTDYRLIDLARDQHAQLEELNEAVDRAGGRERIRALGGATVNPFVHTALAWKLNERLAAVQPTWSSSRRKPNWSPPTVLFRAPSKLAGPRPAIPPGTRTSVLARSGRWRVTAVP